MAKLDVLKKLKYIEEKYPVETINYRNIKIWPFIRCSIFNIYYFSDEVANTTVGNITETKIQRVFSALKLTSIVTFFKKHAVIVFTDDVGMKNFHGEYIDRIMQGIFSEELSALPVVTKIHSQEVISLNKYVHADFLSFFIKLFSWFLPIKKNQISGGNILKNIISELEIQFDFFKYLKTINGALYFYSMWFSMIKPRKIYVNCYYDLLRMPAFFVAKQACIPIIEVQHGSITSEPAYKAFKAISEHPYPNYLFVFGDRFKYGVSKHIYERDAIFSTGSYYIDLMLQDKNRNSELFHKKYPNLKDKIIITVASQYDIDREILDFTMQTASMDKRFFFIFIPRFIKDYHKKFKHANISIETELDVYQCMQNSHITSAVVSTCAVESLAFGTPTVLINIGGLAVFNYADFFSEIHSVLYADTPDEYVQQIYKAIAFDRVSVAEEGKLFFADNYSERLKDAIIKIESK
ncbi:hypothetical protein [Treponema pedis]|uniref:Uncharacterized protein n=1 Tax=Treponema pedis TaxID=409322 RepID=A0A7S7AXL1_9SPIR|nr:hypothetical protein [Treponema pedis]QOW61716.1 hypothetical protein IFE08_04915 [Treponema pedis]